jgi:hypothetical protein
VSVSSYGRVINSGSLDPFDYGLPSLREGSEDMMSIAMSSDIDDTFAFMENRPRQPMLQVSILKHHPLRNMDTPSFVDTVIEIPVCRFHGLGFFFAMS